VCRDFLQENRLKAWTSRASSTSLFALTLRRHCDLRSSLVPHLARVLDCLFLLIYKMYSDFLGFQPTPSTLLPGAGYSSCILQKNFSTSTKTVLAAVPNNFVLTSNWELFGEKLKLMT